MAFEALIGGIFRGFNGPDHAVHDADGGCDGDPRGRSCAAQGRAPVGLDRGGVDDSQGGGVAAAAATGSEWSE